MNIIRLKYINYRNLKNDCMIPCKGMNIIYGENAQGKTNLLEAMWLFTGGHSFRGSKDNELAQFGETKCSLSLDFNSENREQTAEISFENGKRHCKINQVEKKSTNALIGKFCAVIFSPEHLSLVKGGPSLRRTFIDGALCQLKPSYAKTLFLYNRTLTQRNALLKDIPKHSELIETLEVWDEKLAKAGTQIILERTSYLNQIHEEVQNIYSGISKNKELFTISYQSAINCNFNKSQELEQEFRLNLIKTRKKDLSAGFTTIGPHRDDLDFEINQISARTFGSQGQQRSIVLALKLAEAQALRLKNGEAPIIFLDDVMSELDANRQDYLLNQLEDQQVFITCCEPESIKKLKDGMMFQMQNGVLNQNRK